METLSISKEKAIEIYNDLDAAGKLILQRVFKKETFTSPVKITDRVKTYEDACKILNKVLKKKTNVKRVSSKNKQEMALDKLQTIIEALNEGWTPDWTNENEYKYYPWFKIIADQKRKAGFGLSFHAFGATNTSTIVGSRLCYRTRELAEYGAKQFIELYIDFMLS